MRLLVFGGRRYGDYVTAFYTLDEIHRTRGPVTVVIHGAMTGADSLGRQWAKENGIKHRPFRADWDNLDAPGAVIKYSMATGRPYNAAAGPDRNQMMIDVGKPDLAVQFPGGRGTADMRERLRVAEIEVIEVPR